MDKEKIISFATPEYMPEAAAAAGGAGSEEAGSGGAGAYGDDARVKELELAITAALKNVAETKEAYNDAQSTGKSAEAIEELLLKYEAALEQEKKAYINLFVPGNTAEEYVTEESNMPEEPLAAGGAGAEAQGRHNVALGGAESHDS